MNRMFGQAGADELLGGSGDDILVGGAGRDLLGAASGADSLLSDVDGAADADFGGPWRGPRAGRRERPAPRLLTLMPGRRAAPGAKPFELPADPSSFRFAA